LLPPTRERPTLRFHFQLVPARRQLALLAISVLSSAAEASRGHRILFCLRGFCGTHG
jgi:hypothetical protein